MAMAVTGPMPGIAISRTVSSHSRALVRIFRSSPSIFVVEILDPPEQHRAQLDDRLRQATVPVLDHSGQLPDPWPCPEEPPRRTRAQDGPEAR